MHFREKFAEIFKFSFSYISFLVVKKMFRKLRFFFKDDFQCWFQPLLFQRQNILLTRLKNKFLFFKLAEEINSRQMNFTKRQITKYVIAAEIRSQAGSSRSPRPLAKPSGSARPYCSLHTFFDKNRIKIILDKKFWF